MPVEKVKNCKAGRRHTFSIKTLNQIKLIPITFQPLTKKNQRETFKVHINLAGKIYKLENASGLAISPYNNKIKIITSHKGRINHTNQKNERISEHRNKHTITLTTGLPEKKIIKCEVL